MIGEGRRLVSLNELKRCVAAPCGGGEDAVRYFLLESQDIPASLRRLPLWRLKFVPKIMAQLLTNTSSSAKEKEVAGGGALNEEAGGGGAAAAKRRRRSTAH